MEIITSTWFIIVYLIGYFISGGLTFFMWSTMDKPNKFHLLYIPFISLVSWIPLILIVVINVIDDIKDYIRLKF